MIKIHNKFKSVPIHVSRQLEMFPLNIWVSKVDLSKSIKYSIDTIKRSKKTYNNLDLTQLSTKLIQKNYDKSFKMTTDVYHVLRSICHFRGSVVFRDHRI